MKESEQEEFAKRQQEQMLKLVTKGFYNELVNYGVKTAEILTIASHLLDHVMAQEGKVSLEGENYSRLFTEAKLRNDWETCQQLGVERVGISPLQPSHLDAVLAWLEPVKVRESFITPYPETKEGLGDYFADPGRRYFTIDYDDQPAGIIGAENMDASAGRLEMRKLVGNSELRGKGIGKRATFAFLFYVFKILDFEKVYIHSTDVNVRNLNLNSRFGFQLEGVFMQEILASTKRLDVVRMGLLKSRWTSMFGGCH